MLLVLIDSNRGRPVTANIWLRLLPSRNPAQAACREVCEPNRRHRVLLNGWSSPQILRRYGGSARRAGTPPLRPHHERVPLAAPRAMTAAPCNSGLRMFPGARRALRTARAGADLLGGGARGEKKAGITPAP